MEFISTQKYIRITPRKLREAVFMVRGLKPTQAIEILPHSRKRGASVIFKALKVAVANATNKGANAEELILKEIQVNDGTKLKRFRAGSRGTAKPYQRRMSHLRIVLAVKSKNKVLKEDEKKVEINKNSEGVLKGGSSLKLESQAKRGIKAKAK